MRGLHKGAAVKVMALLLAGIGLGVAATYVSPMMRSMLNGLTNDAHAAVENPGSSVGVMYPLKERVVNLADPGVLRYLKISVVLEFEPRDRSFYQLKGEARSKREAEIVKELGYRHPILADLLTTILTSKTSVQLMSPDGKERLKQEILEQVNMVTGEDRVIAVHFTDFIIQ